MYYIHNYICVNERGYCAEQRCSPSNQVVPGSWSHSPQLVDGPRQGERKSVFPDAILLHSADRSFHQDSKLVFLEHAPY